MRNFRTSLPWWPMEREAKVRTRVRMRHLLKRSPFSIRKLRMSFLIHLRLSISARGSNGSDYSYAWRKCFASWALWTLSWFKSSSSLIKETTWSLSWQEKRPFFKIFWIHDPNKKRPGKRRIGHKSSWLRSCRERRMP
jgi:hypothetical protein